MSAVASVWAAFSPLWSGPTSGSSGAPQKQAGATLEAHLVRVRRAHDSCLTDTYALREYTPNSTTATRRRMGDQFPQYGNATTHNLEAVLHTNILNSRYSRGLEQLDFNELIDEIYSNVRGRAASVAACGPHDWSLHREAVWRSKPLFPVCRAMVASRGAVLQCDARLTCLCTACGAGEARGAVDVRQCARPKHCLLLPEPSV